DGTRLTVGLVEAWLRDGVTAFVVETPGQASRLIDLAASIGYRMPADYSMAVLADVHYSEKASDDWARLKVPRVAMGRAAVQLLVSVLAGVGGAGVAARPQMVKCEVEFGATIVDVVRR